MINQAKIVIRKIIDEKGTKAIAFLDFGSFKIKGFRVRGNDEGSLWVNPPSVQVNGKYMPIFFIEDKNEWHLLQSKIIEEYNYNKPPKIIDDFE